MFSYKSSLAIFLAKILSMVAIFIFGAFVARFYGVEKFSSFIFIQSLMFFFSFIYHMGIDQLIYRELSLHRNPTNVNYLTLVFKYKLISFVGYALIIWLILFLLDETHYESIFLSLIFYHFSKGIIVFRQSLETKALGIIILATDVFSSILAILICWLLYTYQVANFLWYFWPVYVLLSTYFQYIYINHEKVNYICEKGFFDLKPIFKEASPLLFAVLLSAIFMQSDVIMLKYFGSHLDVGTYGVAMSLIQPFLIIPTILMTVLFSKLTYFYMQEKQTFWIMMKSISNIMFFLALITVTGFYLLSEFVVHTFFGKEFDASVEVLRLLSINFLFTFPAAVYSRYLILERETRHEFRKTLLAALLNIILNCLLIPQYGVMGAVAASLVAYFTSDFAYYLFFYRDIRLTRILVNSINIFLVYFSLCSLRSTLSKK
ncbi:MULTISPECIES: oligosaccharide flippase family protein [unclassified Pseudoalteromonas]|uniref:oligosaccharide flippase family protein n=1 Tax=unclassified Pseudoalteromonas TaxID=194690 RepID=UPI00048F9A28|nr:MULTISPECIES: polysaccharide biosynthesis C-terminal domain-containing protein [unclassified Pseudoalteromonas]